VFDVDGTSRKSLLIIECPIKRLSGISQPIRNRLMQCLIRVYIVLCLYCTVHLEVETVSKMLAPVFS
jgi:hypothetical protein